METLSPLNILIPMAGDGARFQERGYREPKPLISVDGEYMVDIVLNNITPKIPTKTILVTKSEHKIKDRLKNTNYIFIELIEKTAGTLETILKAKDTLDLTAPLLLANCDQLIKFDVNDFIKLRPEEDGSLITFTSCNPHHSYVKINTLNYIETIVEKEVISNNAVAGVYYFKKCNDFISAAEEAIKNNIKTKNEFYVSSAIKIMIERGSKFGCYDAKSIMLGTPDELENYLKYE
jgi:NDP-sugar pyrophosphorylase family protein